MESIQRYWKRTDKMYLLLCLFSSAMAVLALSSWAAKQGSGFAVDELTGQITGIGDYRRAVVQAGAAAIGILVAILLSNIDYRSLVNVWPVHVVLTWGLVLPTLVIRNVTIGPLTIGYNAGDTDNYSWYKLGGFTFQPTELAKISFILTFAMHLNNVRSRLNEPKELGKLLLQGEDAPKDVKAAIRWLTAAAEQGNQYAQYALGKLYLIGKEVPKDRSRAIKWFQLAADQGNEYAQYFLKHMDDRLGQPPVAAVISLFHHLANIFQEQNQPPPSGGVRVAVDRKLLRKIKAKKIAQGHKADDHEPEMQL